MMLFIILAFNLLSTKIEQRRSSCRSCCKGWWGGRREARRDRGFFAHICRDYWTRWMVSTKQPGYREDESARTLSLSLLCL